MMKKYIRIALFWLFPFAEVALTIFLTKQLGAGPTLLLFIVPAIIGLIIQYRHFQHIKSVWKRVDEKIEERRRREKKEKSPMQDKRPTDPDEQAGCTEIVIYWLTIFLLLVPGLLSHLLAFYLMWPGVLKRIITRMHPLQATNSPSDAEGPTD